MAEIITYLSNKKLYLLDLVSEQNVGFLGEAFFWSSLID